mmetsp:Transcript_131903/g.328919  ORF Transcript_131903/g.328919 Transcript_131903/m.328919 type:complete len:273 (-) Transcript_131903:581-1399(-)
MGSVASVHSLRYLDGRLCLGYHLGEAVRPTQPFRGCLHAGSHLLAFQGGADGTAHCLRGKTELGQLRHSNARGHCRGSVEVLVVEEGKANDRHAVQHCLVHRSRSAMRDEGPHLGVGQDCGLRHPSLGTDMSWSQILDAPLNKLWCSGDQDPPRPLCDRLQQPTDDASCQRSTPYHGAQTDIDDGRILGGAPCLQPTCCKPILLCLSHAEVMWQHRTDIAPACRYLTTFKEIWQDCVNQRVRDRFQIFTDHQVLGFICQIARQGCELVLRMP